MLGFPEVPETRPKDPDIALNSETQIVGDCDLNDTSGLVLELGYMN